MLTNAVINKQLLLSIVYNKSLKLPEEVSGEANKEDEDSYNESVALLPGPELDSDDESTLHNEPSRDDNEESYNDDDESYNDDEDSGDETVDLLNGPEIDSEDKLSSVDELPVIVCRF